MLMDHPDILHRIAEVRIRQLRADSGKRAPYIVDTPAIMEHRSVAHAPISAAGRFVGWFGATLRGEPVREVA